MFAKFFQKTAAEQPQQQQQQQQQAPPPQESLKSADLDPRLSVHYGIPSTASILAFDSIQSLLAVGTLDGRIKVIGADHIEGLLVSPKQSPLKRLEFLQNQGFLVSVSCENEIQVWDLEKRRITSTLQWESNITAFSVIHGTSYMYLGDEYGMISVAKYEAEEGKLILLPYYVPTNVIADVVGISSLNDHPVVAVLPQPCSQGNRLLIAYENGLIVIWDVSEDRVILHRGNDDLHLKGTTVSDSPEGKKVEDSDCLSDNEQVEKEICSLCWASTDGSILSVGYADGDIMFWDLTIAAPKKDQQAAKIPKNVVKLQLSSGRKRLPVIVLHCFTKKSPNNRGCQLFVYGGDEIGSEEVLTILSLDWSSGIESLKCVARVDLTLNGSFADMVLVPRAGDMESNGNFLFLLTNPGQLLVYDDACLSSLMSKQENRSFVSSVQYCMPIPTVDPPVTVSKLACVYRDGEFSKALSKIVSAAKLKVQHTPTTGISKWPLTGGIPSFLSEAADYQVERVFAAGYQDGSVRIWDATYPAFSLIFVLGTEVEGINICGASASISALDICSFTLTLATGNESGMVSLYKLIRSSDEMTLNIVTDIDKRVQTLHQVDGPQCTAVFTLLNSPICMLQFANFGARLAVGFMCGKVAMLDISAFTVLFLTESLSDTSSPVNSLAVKSIADANTFADHLNESTSESVDVHEKWVTFVMTKDARVTVLDSTTGNVISSHLLTLKKDSLAVSMYVIEGDDIIYEVPQEKQSLKASQILESENETAEAITNHGVSPPEGELETNTALKYFGQRLKNLLILLCFEDALHLYTLESFLQGHCDTVREVNLLKPCRWTAMVKKDEREYQLVLLYQTGVLEIRSLTTLEVVGESSLMSILRWNFKTNMEKTMCFSNSGQIMLINGCEFATISILAHENDFRMPDSLPCLHDKVLAAAVDATACTSPSPNQSQDYASGILGGIIKGLKAGKVDQNADQLEACTSNLSHLESIFSNPPFLKPATASMDEQGIVELNIDDIDIDEPVTVTSSSEKINKDRTEKETERERLFEGGSKDAKPQLRTPEEIRAKYRGAEDAAAAAARARDRLVQRQEKLERLNERTQELQDGAQNFAEMAKELAKRMEKRRWWHI